MKSLVAIVLASAAMAPCLWDSDTLDTEVRGLPEAFDLVVGRWHRHSDAYYEARANRLNMQGGRTPGECDDLAVAYERLGRRSDAIAVMQEKAMLLVETPSAEHQYRYHANLGTFFAHDARFDEALVELKNAIAINPDAHFGREVFQIELIEYVVAARRSPSLWETHSFLRHAGYKANGFGLHMAFGHLYESLGDMPFSGERKLSWDAAYEAVAGMLRFGGLEGPELYRSLGELFLQKEHLNLAWWSFARAIERGHPAASVLVEAQRAIEAHWDEARPHKSTGHVNPTADDYRLTRASADRWLAAFQQAEVEAIAAGDEVNSDEALRRLLAIADAAEPRKGEAAQSSPSSWRKAARWSLVGGALLTLAYILWLRRRP